MRSISRPPLGALTIIFEYFYSLVIVYSFSTLGQVFGPLGPGLEGLPELSLSSHPIIR